MASKQIYKPEKCSHMAWDEIFCPKKIQNTSKEAEEKGKYVYQNRANGDKMHEKCSVKQKFNHPK